MSRETIQANVLSHNGRPVGAGFFLPFLLLIMSAYPPLATDMYLPSLPNIVETFHTVDSKVNLTLVLFFLFFAFSTLVWGPVSDKFGRKPSLMTGVLLFTLASLGCAGATSVNQMILFRVLQAIGAGAPVTISIAIVQDTYSGESKRKILAILSALGMLAPVIAPPMGTIVLMVAHWRVVFILLAILGVFSLVGCFFIRESLPKKNSQTVLQTFGHLFGVMKNPFFRKTLLIFSLPALFVMGFVGGSASIFMTEFGESSTRFSLFFATNALLAIAGSGLFVPAAKRFSDRSLATASFLSVAVSGLLIVTIGRTEAIFFLICVLPGTLMSALIRPLSVNMMMDAGGANSGAASSMINFFFMLLGSIGMQVIALDWPSRALVYGILTILVGLACLLLWPGVYKITAAADESA